LRSSAAKEDKVARRQGKCGGATVDYDDAVCAFQCKQIGPGYKPEWSLVCPDGKGGWTTVTGTGLVVDEPPTEDTVVVAGNLLAIAEVLRQLWERPFTVPAGQEGKIVRRRALTGSPEKMAKALGLELGPEEHY
jgi:hypothetical protein